MKISLFGNGSPLQYSCLENSMDRGPWWATVHGVAQSQTQLSHWTELNWTETHLLGFPAETHLLGFPGDKVVKNLPANAGDTGLIPGSGRSPRRKWQPTPIFLPGGSHGQKRLAGYSPWGCRELAMTQWLNSHSCNHGHMGFIPGMQEWLNICKSICDTSY